MTKTAYEAPEVVELGSFEEMTQGNASGTRTDASFPTPGAVATFLS